MKRFFGITVAFVLALTLFSACSSGGSSSNSSGYDVAYGLIDYENFWELTDFDWVNKTDQKYTGVGVGITYDDGDLDIEYTLRGMLKDLATCTELSIANGTLKVAMDVSWSEIEKLLKNEGTISSLTSDFRKTLNEIGANFYYLRLSNTDDQVLWIGVELSIYDILSDYM